MISMPRSPAIVQTALAGNFNPESFVPSKIGPMKEYTGSCSQDCKG